MFLRISDSSSCALMSFIKHWHNVSAASSLTSGINWSIIFFKSEVNSELSFAETTARSTFFLVSRISVTNRESLLKLPSFHKSSFSVSLYSSRRSSISFSFRADNPNFLNPFSTVGISKSSFSFNRP